MTEKEFTAELLMQNAELRARNEELLKLLQQALNRIKDLEMQLNANSKNSSKPLSSDGPEKKPVIPRNKGAKRGGKNGLKGGKLNFLANPDAVQVHGPTGKCSCGQCPSEEQVIFDGKGRQVFDLPEKLLKVVEHQVGKVTCSGCGEVHKGAFSRIGTGTDAVWNAYSGLYNDAERGVKSAREGDLRGGRSDDGAADLEVPFANNLAERDIRPLKTKLKVSTSFRTFKGVRIYSCIKGFCSTARKQGINLFDALIGIFYGTSCFAKGEVVNSYYFYTFSVKRYQKNLSF